MKADIGAEDTPGSGGGDTLSPPAGGTSPKGEAWSRITFASPLGEAPAAAGDRATQPPPPPTSGSIICSGEAATVRFAEGLAAELRAGDVVLLFGEMGVGKSVVSRAIGRALGVTSPMPSPTFTVMIPYDAKVPIIHFDLFRLEDEDAFHAAGLGEYIGGNAVCLVEWPDVFLPLFDKAARKIEVRISYGEEEDERTVQWSVKIL